jgi:hypothetical protein
VNESDEHDGTDAEAHVANLYAAWSLAALRVSVTSSRAADARAAVTLRADLDALTGRMSELRPPAEALNALLRAHPAFDIVPRFASMTHDERAVWCLALLLDERPGLRAFGCALHGLPVAEQVERLAALLTLPVGRIDEALAQEGRLRDRSLVSPQGNPDHVAWITPGVEAYLVLPPAAWPRGHVVGLCAPLGVPRGLDIFGHLRTESVLLGRLVTAARNDGKPANVAVIAPNWMRPRDFVQASLSGCDAEAFLIESEPGDALSDWETVTTWSDPANGRVFVVDPPTWTPDALDSLHFRLEDQPDESSATTIWRLRPEDDPDGRLDGLFDLMVVVSPPPEADRRVTLAALLVDAGLDPEHVRVAVGHLPPVHLDLAERAIATVRRLGVPQAEFVVTLQTLLRPHAGRRGG